MAKRQRTATQRRDLAIQKARRLARLADGIETVLRYWEVDDNKDDLPQLLPWLDGIEKRVQRTLRDTRTLLSA